MVDEKNSLNKTKMVDEKKILSKYIKFLMSKKIDYSQMCSFNTQYYEWYNEALECTISMLKRRLKKLEKNTK